MCNSSSGLTVLCITCKHLWGWFDWLVPLQAYKIIIVLFTFTVLFSTKTECSVEQLQAADPPYCWLYPSKQVVDCFYSPTWNAQSSKFWQQIPLAHTVGRWQIIDCDEYE